MGDYIRPPRVNPGSKICYILSTRMKFKISFHRVKFNNLIEHLTSRCNNSRISRETYFAELKLLGTI